MEQPVESRKSRSVAVHEELYIVYDLPDNDKG